MSCASPADFHWLALHSVTNSAGLKHVGDDQKLGAHQLKYLELKYGGLLLLEDIRKLKENNAINKSDGLFVIKVSPGYYQIYVRYKTKSMLWMILIGLELKQTQKLLQSLISENSCLSLINVCSLPRPKNR